MDENLTADRVLEQSLELNRIQADLLKEKSKSGRAPWIVCAIVALCFTVALCTSFWFFSQYEFYTETTVTQDTGEGVGNNVYFQNDGNTYNEAPRGGEE